MSESSGFFTSSGGDRKYTAAWLADYVARLVSNGVGSGELEVTANGSGMNVSVAPGAAFISGYMYKNSAALTAQISTADGSLGRIDNVCVRLDLTNRKISLVVINGTYAASPVAPDPTRTTDIYDLVIARVTVAAGTTAITEAMITDTRANSSLCGIVTGAAQLDFADYITQLQESFETWFEEMKGQLSEDAAGHLQLEIDKKIGEPTSEGFSGQALLTDGAGGRSWGTVGIKIYTGTTEPSSSTGANGDFYFKTK